MAGYTRQSSALIMAGNEVTASPINAEFNALQTAFSAVSGHTHDASTGNGPKINLTTSVVSTLPIANGGTAATTQNQAQINLGYTAADVLAKLVTVDGFGSGLDSDYLDGFDVEELVQIDYNQVITSVKTVTLGTAVTAGTYQAYKPIDYGVGKPGLFIDKRSTATIWEIGLWDTATSTGTINFLSSILTHNSAPIVTTTGTQTLTNKTLSSPTLTGAIIEGTVTTGSIIVTPIISLGAAITTFQDDIDPTKQMQFQLSGITTATTRTLTVPNASGTIVLDTNTVTMTNKTLNSPTLNNATLSSVTANGLFLSDATIYFGANDTLSFDDTTNTFSFSTDGIPGVATIAGVTLTTATITTPTITLRDINTTFEDNADSTKKMQFQLSGITTGTTRTLTVPDATTTLYGMSNILGTASQSGGIPTGAIIETGSNANGSYVRYANGTQVCYQVQSNTADAWTTAAGSLFISSVYTWTFPAAFVTSFPVLNGGVIRNSAQATGIAFASQSTTAATWYGWCSSSVAGGTQKTSTLVAIGNWY